MQFVFIVKRFGVFLLIVWLAATLNFFLPRLSGQDPVRAKLLQQAALGGYVQGGIEEMTREYERRFGLDQPLWHQYLTYLHDVSRLDFNYSIASSARARIASGTVTNPERLIRAPVAYDPVVFLWFGALLAKLPPLRSLDLRSERYQGRQSRTAQGPPALRVFP